MEDKYPGLWQRWFRHQCVAVGWPPGRGYTLEGNAKKRSWAVGRKALKRIENDDWILVQLRGHRVGRVGQVVSKKIKDNEWNPLVPRTRTLPNGEQGRRINVRWDLNVGPTDTGMVVKLPESKRLSSGLARNTLVRLDKSTFKSVVDAMKKEANWVSLLSQFGYERSLSDYIGTNPHHLEDGLQPFPSKEVREKVFKNGSRSDVLLIDRDGKHVIVECKQAAPTIENVEQLRNYMKLLRKETGKKPRGILVHGGARKLRKEVRREVNHKPRVDVVQYSLSVGFAPCRQG